jgi:hypothetical protein
VNLFIASAADQPAALRRTILARSNEIFPPSLPENKMQKAHPPLLRVNIVARVLLAFCSSDFLLNLAWNT